jgi:hypothetical protein
MSFSHFAMPATLAAGGRAQGTTWRRVPRVLRIVTVLKGGPVIARRGSVPERTGTITNPWVVFALLVEVGTLVGYFRWAGPLVLPIATLCGISLVIGGVWWAIRGSWTGFLLVGVAVGVPGFMLWHPHHLARVVRDRMGDYQAALPAIFAADAARCPHHTFLHNWCEVHDLLPDRFRSLSQTVAVSGAGDEPLAVLFHLLPGRHAIVAYAPTWQPREPSLYRSLGNGWLTTLPR